MEAARQEPKVSVRYLRTHYRAGALRPREIGQLEEIPEGEARSLESYGIVVIEQVSAATNAAANDIERLQVAIREARKRKSGFDGLAVTVKADLEAARDPHTVQAASARLRDLQPAIAREENAINAFQLQLERLTGDARKLAAEIVTRERRLSEEREKVETERQRVSMRISSLNREEHEITRLVSAFEALIGKEIATTKLRELRYETEPRGAGIR